MTKGSSHQDDTTIINIYSPKNRHLKYMERKTSRIEGEIDKPTTIG